MASADSKTAATFSLEEGLTYHPPSASEPKHIETSKLIALLPPTSDTSSPTHTLLYLNTSSSAKPTDNPTLSALRLSSPPESLISRFALDPQNLPPHLRLGSSDTHVIVSTSSGLHKSESYHENIIRPLFEKLGIEYTLHKTTSADSIRSFTSDLLICYSHGYTNTVSSSTSSSPDSSGFNKLVILLSGDTVIQELIDALPPSHARLRFLLSVIPLGTANALASSLQLGLGSLLHGSAHHLPTFTARFSPGSQYVLNEGTGRLQIGGGILKGCVVCSWGFHASLVGGSDTVEYRVHGNERFQMLARELAEGKWGYEESKGVMHVYRGHVSLRNPSKEADTKLLDSNEKEERGHSYVMLPMIPRLEPTFTISPGTSTTLTPLGGDKKKKKKEEDGKVEEYVVYIPSTTPEKLTEMMMQAYAGGKHVERDDVGYYKAGGFRIDMQEPDDTEGDKGRWRWVCIDGKIIEVEEGGYVEVEVDQEVEDWGVLWRE